jgi:hypothetical protein
MGDDGTAEEEEDNVFRWKRRTIINMMGYRASANNILSFCIVVDVNEIN